MLQQLGGVTVPIDFEPFAATANLLYTSAFLAERYSGVRTFLEAGQVCRSLPLIDPCPAAPALKSYLRYGTTERTHYLEELCWGGTRRLT